MVRSVARWPVAFVPLRTAVASDALAKGTLDMPWYVYEIPTILVSTASPNVLPDMPQVKTYVSAFDDKDFNIDILLDKLEGKSEFTGTPANEMFVFPDTRI